MASMGKDTQQIDALIQAYLHGDRTAHGQIQGYLMQGGNLANMVVAELAKYNLTIDHNMNIVSSHVAATPFAAGPSGVAGGLSGMASTPSSVAPSLRGSGSGAPSVNSGGNTPSGPQISNGGASGSWSQALIDHGLGDKAPDNFFGANGGTNESTGGVGSTGDPTLPTGGQDYSNTFFGKVQPDALGELSGDPNSAWSLFKQRGGPGGGGLENSTASQYGEDDFKAFMALAPFLAKGGGAGLSSGQTLGFADTGMKSAMGGGGQYVDPKKILDQVFANMSSDPSSQNQELGVVTAINSLAPFMDPTSYRMLQNRVGQVMDQYTAGGLENGTQDLNGVLLKMIAGAVGGR